MEPNEMHETRQVMLAQGKLIKDLQAQINGLTERFEVHHHQQGKDVTGSPVWNSQDEEWITETILVGNKTATIKYKAEKINRKVLRQELRQLAAEAQHCCPRGFAERIDQLADRV